MSALQRVSTITDKGQTTVPKAVRDALGVGPGDRIAFLMQGDVVTIRRADDDAAEDPVVGSFLSFLARDMERHPELLLALSPALVERIAHLTKGILGWPGRRNRRTRHALMSSSLAGGKY